MLPQDRSAAKGTPRVIVDAMLGRLAKWLRLAGYDALYWRDGSDEELIAAAQAQGRVIITRDRQLAGRRGVHAVLVAAEALDDQIAEARALLGGHPEPFTRCPECNGPLQELAHADARELVPPYVWHTQTAFRRCQGCGRVYWKGSHWPAVLARLEGK
ncbi:MAG: Mut7-C RNAse domain-containing protein [Anaerolineae bacterium]